MIFCPGRTDNIVAWRGGFYSSTGYPILKRKVGDKSMATKPITQGITEGVYDGSQYKDSSTTPKGWVCPKCDTSNAPWASTCQRCSKSSNPEMRLAGER